MDLIKESSNGKFLGKIIIWHTDDQLPGYFQDTMRFFQDGIDVIDVLQHRIANNGTKVSAFERHMGAECINAHLV